jgi:FixJ family two-component response regulator
MPGLKGDNLLIKIHEKFPSVVKIMLTGQADEEAVERSRKEANLFACLGKPWETNDLISTIKRGLQAAV